MGLGRFCEVPFRCVVRRKAISIGKRKEDRNGGSAWGSQCAHSVYLPILCIVKFVFVSFLILIALASCGGIGRWSFITLKFAELACLGGVAPVQGIQDASVGVDWFMVFVSRHLLVL